MTRLFPYAMWFVVMLPFSYGMATIGEIHAVAFWKFLGIYP